jgi:hypothetical protein
MKVTGRVLIALVLSFLVSYAAFGQQPAAAPLPGSCASNLHNSFTVYNEYRSDNNSAVAYISSHVDFVQPNAHDCLYDLAAQRNDDMQKDIAAARQSLLTAVANYSPQAQQGATTSSASSVSPISKLLGLTSIGEEFAGVNVSSASSSMTFSVSGQTLLEDLVTHEVLLPCLQGQTSHCIKKSAYGFWRRFTPSVSAITTSATKGMANSTATPTPVTLSTPGSTWPSFGGFGLKYVAKFRDSSTGAANPGPDVTTLLKNELKVDQESDKCPEYQTAVNELVEAMSETKTEEAFDAAYIKGYPGLLSEFGKCLTNSSDNIADFQQYAAAQAISLVADDDANTTPMIGFEYDLNTPLNQPSYSTAKGSFSWQWGKPPAAAKGAAPSSGSAATSVTNKEMWASAVRKEAVSTITNPPASAAPGAAANAPASTNNAGSPTTATTKAAAGAETPTWTINLMVDGEFYNTQPPSSVPSEQRLRDVQVGFEADWVLRGSHSPNSFIKFIGDSTLSGSYLYQDQTSAAIVNAPPSGISFSNLPSTASTVYATRGPINLGQIRWGLGTGSNLTFPIAFTYSNRSALIDHPIKGLQFGISYNLSSLFSNNSGSSKAGAAGAGGQGDKGGQASTSGPN